MKNCFTYILDKLTTCTSDISILTLKPVSHPSLNYAPGQYVEVKLSEGEYLPLSIANIPRDDGSLEFHLRHDAHSNLAVKFIELIKKNTLVEIQGPKGICTLSRIPQCEGLIFLAGGTGFAPLKALLEEILANNSLLPSLYLYWGVRRPVDAYDEKRLKDWQQQYQKFSYELVLSEPEAFPHWQGNTGLVPDFIAKKHPELKNYCVFASGPFPMIKKALSLFTHLGLAPQRFFSDMIL